MKKTTLSRRKFLAAAAAGISAPTIVPSTVFGQNAPSNRLTLAAVGTGSQFGYDIQSFAGFDDVQIVGLCDVDRSRVLDGKKRVEGLYAKAGRQSGGIATYGDFRDVVTRDDVDLVSIHTCDHWHVLVGIAAADAGKQIYCQKPLSLNIAEGRALVNAVRRNGTVLQVGSQQRSDRNFRFACELVRNGRIGKLNRVEVGLPPGKSIPAQPTMPVPDGFDYNFWLGPAPWAPYTEMRCHWNFRWISDYAGGYVTDWGAHHCDIAQWGMGTEHTGPVAVEGTGFYEPEKLWDVAQKFRFACTYANGVVMDVADETQIKHGITFKGSDGWVFVRREAIDAEPKSLLSEVIRSNETRLYRSANHYRNFVDCAKTGEEPAAPVEIGHRSISVCHLGNIAMLLGRKLRWNPDAERFVDDPGADRMLSREMRSPWRLS